MQKYYEDVIISNPLLYNKVVSTYKNLQRTINNKEKSQEYAKKRLSTNKITGFDKADNVPLMKEKSVRVVLKNLEPEGKNDQ